MFFTIFNELLVAKSCLRPETAPLKFADSDIFSNVRKLLTIGAIFPIGSTEADRAVSGIRNLKKSYRSTMVETRKSNLNLLQLQRISNIDVSDRAKKLKIEGTPSAVFAIETPHYNSCFMSPMLFIFMSIKWVSLSIFPWTHSNLNLEIKKCLNFKDSLWQAIFEIFQICTKYVRLEQIIPLLPY